MPLPPYVREVIHTLKNNGQEAFIVGGCVRDLLMGHHPSDYDVATSALPQETMTIFQKTVPVGAKHGTVAVLLGRETVEVSTFKGLAEGWGGLEQDLLRRDFTFNAIAMDEDGNIFDPFNGQADIQQQLVRSPRNLSKERFLEDPLRMLRAVRFCSCYEFTLHPTVTQAIHELHELLPSVSVERVREEFNRILISDHPVLGMELLLATGLLAHVIPEVMAMVGFDQRNHNHDKDVFRHALAVLEASPPRLKVRLAALLHDIGKPVTFTLDEAGVGHFYGHHMQGCAITRSALQRLKYDHQTIEDVTILVGEHMSRFGKFRNANLKKLVNRVGEHNLQDLYDLQRADIIGSAPPFNFSALDEMQAEISSILYDKPPLKVRDLAINGYDLMEIGIAPGPAMGKILNGLLEAVLENPENNKPDFLLELAKEIASDLNIKRSNPLAAP